MQLRVVRRLRGCLLVLLLCPSVSARLDAQQNGFELFDDFADSDFRDLDPVDWNSQNNCYPLLHSVEGEVRLCDQDNWQQYLLANQTFDGDVSVRTRVHTVGSGMTGCAAHMRLNCFRAVWGYEAWVIPRRHWDNPWVQADVALIRGDEQLEPVIVLGTHNFDEGFDTREEHFVQLDVRGDLVEVRLWYADEPFPEEPLIRIEDTTYRSGEAGVTFIYGPGPSPIRNGECLNFYGAYDFIWIRDRMLGADDVPPSERSAASRFLRGDCNDDGLVELVDAVCTLDGLFGEGGIGCRAALNVNGDEQVDLSDPISLLTHLFLGGPAPVAPFPDCGPGELDTDDELGCEKPLENCQQ